MKTLINIIHNKKGKLIIPFFILGLFGLDVEIIMRALSGDMIAYDNSIYIAFKGWTSVWMIVVYGCGFTLIGLLNELEKYCRLPMIIQTIFGGLLIGLVELIFGIIFNIYPFQLNLWEYLDKYNILNQVCLRNYLLFTISIPFAIWLYDIIGWYLYNEDWKYNILDNYRQILKELKHIKQRETH
jgi:hypothetical protein